MFCISSSLAFVIRICIHSFLLGQALISLEMALNPEGKKGSYLGDAHCTL